jgi:hypothetical protein
VGTAVGIGASTTLAGSFADAFGGRVVFAFLAGVAASGLLVVIGLMPETRRTASGGSGWLLEGYVARASASVRKVPLHPNWRGPVHSNRFPSVFTGEVAINTLASRRILPALIAWRRKRFQ